MNNAEKEGCKKLLGMLDYGDLSSLVDTTTKKQISVTRTSEAIKAIIEYSPSAIELLKRKKMKRDLLFKFLAEQKVIVPVNIDKSGLIRIILKKWGTNIREDDFMDIDLDEDKPTNTKAKNQTSTSAQTLQDAGHQSLDSGVLNQSLNSRNQSLPGGAQGQGNQHIHYNIQVNQSVNVTNVHAGTSSPHNTSQTPQGQSALLDLNNQQCIHPGSSVPDIVNSNNIDNLSSQVVSSEFQTLGEKFAEWFFTTLNSNCPSMQKAPEDFGPHHFWDDAYLLLNSCTPEPNVEKFEGPILVSQRFLAFSKEEQVLFNPNLTREGIYVKSNQHGLVMILVCGTLHRHNECLGIFQQVFGIVKDPRFDNNWKIKMIKLDVKTSKPTDMPKLEGNLDSQIMALVAV